MSETRWPVKLIITRYKQGGTLSTATFTLEVDPDEYVLDAVERVWVFHDRSLAFRHACHHSTCGACGMRVNGVEKLTCITPIREVCASGGTLRIEPLRNFPILSDLVVDMGGFYNHLEEAQAKAVQSLDRADLPFENDLYPEDGIPHERLADCIECGLCVSACPVSLTSSAYAGPAALAAAHQSYLQSRDVKLLDWADSAEGAWRCHSGFECSAVCPSNVDPAWRIMDLRKRIVRQRIQRFFNPSKE
jgi:succinate dehydrogenase/fumarate reductase iron-sulfur protein